MWGVVRLELACSISDCRCAVRWSRNLYRCSSLPPPPPPSQVLRLVIRWRRRRRPGRIRIWRGTEKSMKCSRRRRVVVSAPFIGAIMSSRFPFLDAAVMQFVAQQPLDCLVDYTLAQGSGDKRILRLVAHRLGLTTASTAVKRAIQFGSRIAHVSDKRRFGSRRKATGEAE